MILINNLVMNMAHMGQDKTTISKGPIITMATGNIIEGNFKLYIK